MVLRDRIVSLVRRDVAEALLTCRLAGSALCVAEAHPPSSGQHSWTSQSNNRPTCYEWSFVLVENNLNVGIQAEKCSQRSYVIVVCMGPAPYPLSS